MVKIMAHRLKCITTGLEILTHPKEIIMKTGLIHEATVAAEISVGLDAEGQTP